MATIDKETPVTLRIGLIVGLLAAAVMFGGWANDVAVSLRALPAIEEKIDEIDEQGTSFGRTGDQLIRKDIESLTTKVHEIGDAVRRIEQKVDAK